MNEKKIASKVFYVTKNFIFGTNQIWYLRQGKAGFHSLWCLENCKSTLVELG